MKTSVYLVAVLAILTAYLQNEVLVYKSLVATLMWSNQTLALNVTANREGWHICKWFNICSATQFIPPSKIIRHGEVSFRG